MIPSAGDAEKAGVDFAKRDAAESWIPAFAGMTAGLGRRPVLAAAAAALPLAARAQPRRYPTQPVRIISPFAPGGANDTLARLVAAHLTTAFGQPFVVENRPGAGGNVGGEIVARAAPDGHTLLMGAGAVAINQTLYPRIPFDILRDFAPVSLVAMVPNVLAVHPSVPARTTAEFIAHAKSRPGAVGYGSAGIGTIPHLLMEMFRRAAGFEAVHVPYRGSAPAVTDLIGGRVQAVFENLPPLAGHLRGGGVRGLCVSTAERLPDFPDLPTAAESAGLPGFEVTAWQSVLAPAGTPPDIVEALAAEIARGLATPEGRARTAAIGALPRGSTPAEFRTFLAAEVRKWGEAVRASGAIVE